MGDEGLGVGWGWDGVKIYESFSLHKPVNLVSDFYLNLPIIS